MNPFVEGLKSLGPARLAAMAAVAIGVFAMLGLLALKTGGGSDQMSLLYSDLDLREASQMVDQLDHAHIAHTTSPNGDRIMVPSADVARARLLLAKDGLPSGGSIGYEIFDRGDSLTASAFQQQINETRAIEGELARSIRMINGVRAVRVHIVLPKREPFARDKQEAQASIVLTMAGADRLDKEGTQAILNLVAASVPGLKAQNIALIDSRGDLLARAGEPAGADASATTVEEMRAAIAQRMTHKVEDLLERTLGPGHVRAEATIEMDTDRLEETQESYNPDQQVVRSTQTSNETSKSTEGDKSTSVQNNLPNAAASTNQNGSQSSHQDETTNYEIGKTVRTTVHEQPQLKRLSLAVMVDGAADKAADGTVSWKERPPEELARITSLVKSAVGFDEKRGDTVTVLSMRFVAPDDGAAPEPPKGMLGISFEKSDMVSLAQSGLLGVVALLALLFVIRPMVNRLTTLPAGGLGLDGGLALAGAGGDLSMLSGGQMSGAGGGGGQMGGLAALPSPGGSSAAGGLAALPAPGSEEETMVNVANIDGQLKASSVRRIAELAEKHPEETLTVLRGWMSEGSN